jgi:putative phosphoribosyl transferase
MAAATLTPTDEDVEITLRGFGLPGRLTVPDPALGLVVFAHDAGSDGRNLADRHVADRLRGLGFGTLRFDLRSRHETESEQPTFDLDLLAVRLLVATRWLRSHPAGRGREVAYFGARSGAAVALLAAAADPSVKAVVTRSGRLDLVASALPAVEAPTLLVVGGGDAVSQDVHERTMGALSCPHELVVIPRAGELFVEPGALDATARLAGAWFLRHLRHPKGEALR